ncbi:MAG: response regulator [Candidatus Binataceae bacterium]
MAIPTLGSDPYLRNSLAKLVKHVNDLKQNSSILVVDDDADYCEALSELLSHEGYSVACAGNGRGALDYLSHSIPSLIILDLRMPIMDGREFLRVQKLDPKLRSIPVVLTSGSGLIDDVEVSAVLHKPVDFAVLMHEVRRNYASPQLSERD